MRPTYDTALAIFMSDPDRAVREQRSGLTTPQAVANLFDAMDKAPDHRTRDAIFSNALAGTGVYTSGVEAFDRGTEQMLRDMGNRDATERYAQRMADESHRTPVPWSAERIRSLRDVAAKASLTQGLADRMRGRDQSEQGDPVPRNARLAASGDDARDRRSALLSAVASNEQGDGIVRVREAPTLRDSLADAFDVHADIEAQADPLLDESLRSMSNAV